MNLSYKWKKKQMCILCTCIFRTFTHRLNHGPVNLIWSGTWWGKAFSFIAYNWRSVTTYLYMYRLACFTSYKHVLAVTFKSCFLKWYTSILQFSPFQNIFCWYCFRHKNKTKKRHISYNMQQHDYIQYLW